MKPNIAILGAGFIGMNLLSFYKKNGYNVKVLDRNICPDKLKMCVDWVQGSFFDNEVLYKAVKGTEILFHLISSTVPGDNIDEKDELLSNVARTIDLLKICINMNVKRIIFISSSSVYGPQQYLPIKETAPTNPISSHGIHKLTIEKYMQLYKYKFGLDCKIMRLSNPYGYGQDLYGRQGFIAIALGKILSGEPIEIRGDGSSIRDFIFVDDVVKACDLMAKTTSGEAIFNIGSGTGVSLNDIVNKIQALTRKEIILTYTRERQEDIPASIMDISRARDVLNYNTSISLEEGLKRTMQYLGII